jgi:fused signal recognition particle receptor
MDWHAVSESPALLVAALAAALVVIAASTAVFVRFRRVSAIDAPEEDGVVQRLRASLSRTRGALQGRFEELFRRGVIDESLFEELETTLLTADVGMPTTQKLLEPLRVLARGGERDAARLREVLREGMRSVLRGDNALVPGDAKPWVVLIVGVNGSGKTTTVGKLAAQWQHEGRRVMIAAADTFRAAATDQLKVWAERAGADIVAQGEGADPGAVVYDALSAAKARGHDIVLIDTAGRLQTKKPLMEQLAKIRRVIDKAVPGAPHQTLLVLDGTMGQNAMSQATLFNESTPLTGIIVTKLDGTARGGVVLGLSSELSLPIKMIGTGEKIDDLSPFDPDRFVGALT